MWSMKEGFGELRSLMQLDALDDARRSQLFELMRRGWAFNAALYNAQWLDYMQGFDHHFVKSLALLSSIDELEQAVAFAPHARFALTLRGNDLESKDAVLCVQSAYMVHVASLDLWDNQFGDDAARGLANSPCLTELSSLNLGFNKISSEGVHALAQSAHLAGLTSLDLNQNQLGEEGANAITQSAHLSKQVRWAFEA